MTEPPDLRDLIGDDGEHDERLTRLHELLVDAGPPPEGVPGAPNLTVRALPARARRRRRWAELAVAAALGAVALTVGFLAGTGGDSIDARATISMHGVPPVADASAELVVAERDKNGNTALEMVIKRLPQLPQGGWYELYLSKGGVIGASCGTFATAGDETKVRLNVGYDLSGWRDAGRYDGWVITAHLPGRPGSGERILLMT